MKTIITVTVVDERVSPQPTQSKLIDGNKMLVRIEQNFVLIPICQRMPTYIKLARTFYKLKQDEGGTFQYVHTWKEPRKDAKIVEAEELWMKHRSREEAEQYSEAREAIGVIIKQLLWRRER